MDEEATLGVGFAIDFYDSFGQLKTLDDLVGTTVADAVREFWRLKAATQGAVDLTGAKAQLGEFTNVMTRGAAQAEKAAESMIRQMERQVEVFGKTSAEVRNLRAEQRALAAEKFGNDEAALRLRNLSAELNRLEAASGRAAPSLGGTRSAMQGLSYQVQDTFTQISMGANVLSVLAIQGGQAAGQMTTMQGTMGKVANFIVGPWGLAITGGLLVLGSLTKGLFDNEEASKQAADAMKKFQDRQSDIGNFIDETTGRLIEQNRVLVLNATLTRQAQIKANELSISQGRDAAFKAASGTRVAVSMVGSLVPAQMIDPDVQRAIQAARGDVDKLATSIANLASTKRPDLKGLALDISNQAGQAILAQRENEKLGKELRALGGDTAALATSTTGLIKKQVELATATTPLAKARAQLALVEQGAAAADKAGGAALVKYRNDLAAATRSVNAAEAAEKAASAGRRALSKETREAAKDARDLQRAHEELVRSLDSLIGRFDPARKAAADFSHTLAEINKLASAGMLSAGDALGYKLTAAREAAKADAKARQDEVNRALGFTMGGADDPVEKLAKGWLETADATRYADKAAKDYVGTLYDVSNVLAEISPLLGSAAGLVKGLSTGDFAGVRGPLGALGQLVQSSTGKDGWRTITAKLDQIFGGHGSFERTMEGLLKSAGAGVAAGNVALGGGNSALGSAIGGALGEKVGEKVATPLLKSISKGLGDFAGPLGSIVGGVLGGVLGGLFKSAPRAGAIITSATGPAQITGNNGDAKAAVSTVTSTLQGALQQVASALGASLGGFDVSVGKWKDFYRVAPVATSKVGDKSWSWGSGAQLLYDGTDANEAMRVALNEAIRDGAVKGISEGAQRLLKAGGDLQVQLNKALSFQGVFDQLQQRLDPTTFALQGFDKQLAQLRSIFDEAGASAADYAKLEQLIALQRQDVLDEAAKKELDKLNERRSLEARLMEAQGNAAGALTISRQIELSQTDEALRQLLQQVYAAEDVANAAKGAVDTAEDLSKAWGDVSKSIKEEIDRIRGLSNFAIDGGFAALLGQFNAANAAARAGDMDAAKNLPGMSQALLTAAAQVATSRQELQRVQAQTAASLEATNAAIARLNGTSTSDAALLAASASTQSGSVDAANDQVITGIDALRQELRAGLADLRADMNSGNATIAGNTGRMANKLDNVTNASGGDAIAVVTLAS